MGFLTDMFERECAARREGRKLSQQQLRAMVPADTGARTTMYGKPLRPNDWGEGDVGIERSLPRGDRDADEAAEEDEQT